MSGGTAAAIPQALVSEAVRAALAEDCPSGDVTTEALFSSPIDASGVILAKESLMVAGLILAVETFRQVDPALHIDLALEDGQQARPGETICTITGDGRSILIGERVALNYLQHLSGIATLTARFVQAVHPHPVTILDTRKTIPGLRALQKWAVRLGGGTNHRFSLSEGFMVKDNHLLLAGHQGQSLTDCCRLAKGRAQGRLPVVVEVDRLDQIPPALEGKPDVILLDNMSPETVRAALALIGTKAHTEISGGITLKNVADYAALGPTSISIGALTHSPPAVDIGLDLTIAQPHRAGGGDYPPSHPPSR